MNAKNKKSASKKTVKIEPHGEMVLFQSTDGHTKVQVRFEEKNVWLSQKAMAELYQVSVKTINEHIVNIYDENELAPEATIRKFRIVQTEGKREVSNL